MTSINTTYSSAKLIDAVAPDASNASNKAVAVQQTRATADTDTVISSLASRLSRASSAFADQTSGMSRKDLAAKVQGNIDAVLYPFDETHRAAAALEVPQPSDANSLASAKAATAYVEDSSAPNPFAGLSREQLATISNDDSGTFTINERRAAFMQGYNGEQAWRSKVVDEAMREYNDTGKLTNFFKSVLAHYKDLPATEQVLYPANYASDLAKKIDLDFNYRTGVPGNAMTSVTKDIQTVIQIPASAG